MPGGPSWKRYLISSFCSRIGNESAFAPALAWNWAFSPALTSTGRNQDAVKKTAAGLLKLLYPHRRVPESVTPNELKWVLDLAVEMRMRVTDQLAVILPTEFTQVVYSFRLRAT